METYLRIVKVGRSVGPPPHSTRIQEFNKKGGGIIINLGGTLFRVFEIGRLLM